MKNMRLKFLPGEQRAFIQEVYKKSNCSTEELAVLAGVCARSFVDWRREKLAMTVIASDVFYHKFGVSLPEDKEVMIDRWVNYKREISRKGGLRLFAMYGSPATLEGCRRGGIKAIANLRRNGIIPQVRVYQLPSKYDEDLAEFVGIMLGDGGITPGQCAIILNSEADKDYIQYVIQLGTKLFGEAPKLHLRKSCKAMVIYYNGSSLVAYLCSLGLKIGNKVRQQVDVPLWIKRNSKYAKACLQGLMDTDGGVFLHNYFVNGKRYTYKKISFTNRSIPLLLFTVKTLEDFGFTPRIIDKVVNKKVWLYNQQEVDAYLRVIGTNNTRLLKHEKVYGEVA